MRPILNDVRSGWGKRLSRGCLQELNILNQYSIKRGIKKDPKYLQTSFEEAPNVVSSSRFNHHHHHHCRHRPRVEEHRCGGYLQRRFIVYPIHQRGRERQRDFMSDVVGRVPISLTHTRSLSITQITLARSPACSISSLRVFTSHCAARRRRRRRRLDTCSRGYKPPPASHCYFLS